MPFKPHEINVHLRPFASLFGIICSAISFRSVAVSILTGVMGVARGRSSVAGLQWTVLADRPRVKDAGVRVLSILKAGLRTVEQRVRHKSHGGAEHQPSEKLEIGGTVEAGLAAAERVAGEAGGVGRPGGGQRDAEIALMGPQAPLGPGPGVDRKRV